MLPQPALPGRWWSEELDVVFAHARQQPVQVGLLRRWQLVQVAQRDVVRGGMFC